MFKRAGGTLVKFESGNQIDNINIDKFLAILLKYIARNSLTSMPV